MELEIAVAGAGGEEDLRSLRDWLRDDEDVRRHAAVTLEAGAPGPGEMGAAFEVIKLVLDSGFQLGSLALAYAGWRATRRERAGFELTVRNGATSVTISSNSAQEAERQLRALIQG